MTSAKAKARFEDLQAKWKAAAQEVADLRITLSVAYGKIDWAKKTELNRLETLRNAERRAYDRFFKFLETIQGRDFSVCVPVTFCRDTLTYEDAITKDVMSVVPPPAWGRTEAEMREFARAVKSS
jgi:hypothetical protein